MLWRSLAEELVLSAEDPDVEGADVAVAPRDVEAVARREEEDRKISPDIRDAYKNDARRISRVARSR